MRMLRQLCALALAILLAAASLAFAEAAECPPVQTGIAEIKKSGNLKLQITGDELMALGYEYGDMVCMDIAGQVLDVPICAEYNDVDIGALVLRVVTSVNNGNNEVIASVSGGDLATWLGIAKLSTFAEDPGYRWDFIEPYGEDIAIGLTLKEKGGYLDQIALHHFTMSSVREDYPGLTDEQYANFRNVSTTGMGANALYRSASPVNPKYNRNREADAAVRAAGIRTVMNMADNESDMKGYPGYAETCYSGLDVIPLDMVVDFEKPIFRDGLAEGFRFLASHEGPFLVHCSVGKDRAGFACAVLESLMGAAADEVVADYMVSYYNYYGIEPLSETYEAVADANIRKTLATAFGIDSIASADLAACAEAYLAKIGLTADEISALKTRLGTDYK